MSIHVRMTSFKCAHCDWAPTATTDAEAGRQVTSHVLTHQVPTGASARATGCTKDCEAATGDYHDILRAAHAHNAHIEAEMKAEDEAKAARVETEPPATAPLQLSDFSAANRRRYEAADGFNHLLSSWSTSDWFTAVRGELSEAANIAKKLNRVRDGIPGNKESAEALRVKLAKELGDTFVYLDLLAQSLGISIADAAVDVFNAKSVDIGYPHTLAAAAPLRVGQREEEPMNLRLFEGGGRWFIRGFGFGASGATPDEALRELARTRNTSESTRWPISSGAVLPPASDPLDLEAIKEDWRIIRERKWDFHDQHFIVRPFVDTLVAEIESLRRSAAARQE